MLTAGAKERMILDLREVLVSIRFMENGGPGKGNCRHDLL